MSLGHGPYIPNLDSCYFYIDLKNPKCFVNQNTIKPLIDNDNVGNFISPTGTTTVDGVTVNRSTLASIDTAEGVINYTTLVPSGDISPYYAHGGNSYYSSKNKVWGTGDFTWCIWHYPLTFSQRGYAPTLIDWKYASSVNSEFGLTGSGTPFARYRITTSPFSSTMVEFGNSAILNRWNFTVVKRQSGVAKFFQNGIFSGDFSFNVNYEVAAAIGIGWGGDKDAQWGNYKGKIGPIVTYTNALSDQEISKYFNAMRGRFGI